MRPSVPRTAAALVVLAAAVPLAACDSDPAYTSESAYCVTGTGQVVPDWHCSGSDPLFWYWLGSFHGRYGVGQTINVTNVHVTRVVSTDRAARSRYGMAPTGVVRDGTSVHVPTTSTSSTTSTKTSTKTTTKTTTTTKTGGGLLSKLGGGLRSPRIGGRK